MEMPNAQSATADAALLQELVAAIRSRHSHPEDRFEVAALLETMGWNDERAQRMFGVLDVFALARIVWTQVEAEVVAAPRQVEERRTRVWKVVLELLRQFSRGVIFALPMAVSIVAMLTLKFALWSYENLPLDTATGIGTGTIISFIVVGGFTQAIARRGFFYIMLGYYNMARRITFYFLRMGLLVCVVVSVLLYAINAVFLLFPYSMVTIAIAYFFFLNLIWLSVTVFYILRKELVFTGLVVLGILLVWLQFDVLKGPSILLAQLISLAIVSLIGFVLIYCYFRAAERKMDQGIEPQMPRMSITLYVTMPYFLYGLLYFAFLFLDRINAWSTPDLNIPYAFWFRGPYEIGLDFALLVLIVPMGVAEVIVSKLMTDLEASQKQYEASHTAALNRTFLKKYKKLLLVMTVVSVSSAFAWYGILEWFFARHRALIGWQLFTNPVTHFVFVWALVGYVCVAIALMNCIILFSLSQAKLVIPSIVPAFLVNLLVGFVASRWAHFLIGENVGSNNGYMFAVFGLVAGAICFVLLSTRNTAKLFHKLDYYMYAAA